MRVSEAYPSAYLKAADLQGRTVNVKIDRYTIEEIGDDRKPVLYFVGKEKGLVLNKTNANEIAFVYGDDMDQWLGQGIELFSMQVSFQGKMMPGLRVRVPRPQPQKPIHTAPPQTHGNGGHAMAADLDEEIPFISAEPNRLNRKPLLA